MFRVPGWLRFALFAGGAVCVLFAGTAWAGVIYVRGDAAGAKNGQSWANAYTDLQAGLATAEWGDEIWVAQGTYKPTSGADRTVSFALEAGVGLYGGFAGAETERGQRNWEANPTILSGDIGTTATADNSYHVVTGAHLAVLDGFTVTGGNNGSGSGGGMYNVNSSPTVTNCTFRDNTAGNTWGSHGNGGGMYNSNSSPIVTNCTFSHNSSGYGDGGGMYNTSSSPSVTNCTFSGNTGSGMSNKDSSPTVTNCMFSGNTAIWGYTVGQGRLSGGGGMNNINSSPIVANCSFSGNAANDSGGGMFSSSSSPTVTNCSFSGNTARGWGGGVYGSGTFANCTFTSNTAAVSGGGVYGSGPVANCSFSGNAANDSGGGMWCGGSPVTNCIFWDNSAPLGPEIHTGGGTPTFSHCDIRGSGGSGALWNPALGVDGGGNIMANPRFVAPATPAGPDGLWRTRDDGLRLQSDSPCIGAADPAVAPRTDILGLARKIAPDIGAYEFARMAPASADPIWLLFR